MRQPKLRPGSGRPETMFERQQGGSRRIFLVIALMALLVRLAPLLRSSTDWALKPDSVSYIQLAKGLRAGCGFAQLVCGACARPELIRTPGYPIFLALMPSLRVAIAAQAVMGAMLCLLIGLFVGSRWSVTAGIASEALLALDSPSIVSGAYILSDSLFSALLAAAVLLQLWVITRASMDHKAVGVALFAALLFAMAAFVRPIGQPLLAFAPMPFFLLPGMNWSKRTALSLPSIAIPAFMIYTWAERNRKATGVRTFSAIGAYQLYYFKAAGVIWYRTHESLEAIQKDLCQDLDPQLQHWYETPDTSVHEMTSRALKIIRNDPAAFMAMGARSFVYLAISPGRPDLQTFLGSKGGRSADYKPLSKMGARITEAMESRMLTILVGVTLLCTALIWLGVGAALVGLDWRSRRNAALVLIPFCVALVVMGLAAGPEAYSRFRVPAAPLLAMLSGIGWFGRPQTGTMAPRLGE